MQNRELNNGRLAMIAFVGMLFQEYFTGVPISAFFVDIQKEIDVTAVPENVGILQQFIDGIISAPARVLKSISIAQEFIYKQFNTNQYL